ncbi:54S ribosomal protein L8, mitochondrial [Wickerhamiella sorbophila]|uniref:54S ribosomal protein L8, mitochondrial n=1 Tax=Wickerhamiella sorbophila TaxID=45607 RepID=A0A2T0FKY3_9ASCO|nr:54S ribosomal protein L8, mitochondrial [Wickerhamiella sorbophila]PRT55654.1 54S ribosomal protein L8, mitochondrial [Wickerhamiella sorbophila]
MVHRHLNRTVKHRASLLRNLVTNVLEHESIITTHAKAKEAQTAVERLITKAIKAGPTPNNEKKQRLMNDIYKPQVILPKLLGEISTRYKSFTGGYTRVLKLENRVGDNAPQSILELVGGPRDMRMALTARIVARLECQGADLDPRTKLNVEKICRDDESTRRFKEEVEFMKNEFYTDEKLESLPPLPKYEPKKKAPLELRPNPLNKKQA